MRLDRAVKMGVNISLNPLSLNRLTKSDKNSSLISRWDVVELSGIKQDINCTGPVSFTLFED